MVGQYSAFGSWQLDNDQALILSNGAVCGQLSGY